MSVAGHCGTDCKAFRQYGEMADVGYWQLADMAKVFRECLLSWDSVAKVGEERLASENA
jgi:hypothetical protein